MQLSRRVFLLASGAGLVTAGSALAEVGSLKIVFPFPAGGAADSLLRLIAEQLRTSLNRAVIVENEAGAGGRLGVRTVKASEPDGRTLLFTSGAQMFLQPHLTVQQDYDPFADFTPVMQVLLFDQAIAVPSDSNVNSLLELIQHNRDKPDRATFGSPGVGTLGHFAGAEFGRLTGTSLQHIPYRGTPAALSDLQTGRIGMIVAGAGELIEHHKAGRVRMLALASVERNDSFSEIPTFRESDVDVVAPGYFAFYAPKGLQPEITRQLRAAILKAVNSESFRSRASAFGFRTVTVDDFRQLEEAEFRRWAAIARISGFKPQ